MILGDLDIPDEWKVTTLRKMLLYNAGSGASNREDFGTMAGLPSDVTPEELIRYSLGDFGGDGVIVRVVVGDAIDDGIIGVVVRWWCFAFLITSFIFINYSHEEHERKTINNITFDSEHDLNNLQKVRKQKQYMYVVPQLKQRRPDCHGLCVQSEHCGPSYKL